MTEFSTTTGPPPTIHADPPVVRVDADGVLRVGPTRLLMDLVVHAYQDGATAERIAECYPGVDLKDVYGAIAYYLRHTNEIDRYLDRREQVAEQLRRKLEQEGLSDPDLGRRLKERYAARNGPRPEAI